MKELTDLSFKPLTDAVWHDFERLFGPNGCSGCWCTWWRLTSADFKRYSKVERKELIRSVVRQGKMPGLVAFSEEIPIGWVSVAPREEFIRLERSRTLARVDDKPVWSINCFFIDRRYRRSGLSARLIEEAVKFAKSRGAKIVEAYPIEVHEKTGSASLYYGVAETFRRAGFVEVARRSPEHPIMRKEI